MKDQEDIESTEEMKTSGKKRIVRILGRMFACVLACILALCCLEIYLRYTLEGVHTQSLPQHMIDQHSARGFIYDPDLMWYWDKLPNQGGGINAVGFRRNKSMTVQKPDNVVRVITFGDSQAYGGGVKTEETFSYYAEEALGEGWEVLNAGVSGYRSLNIFRLLRKKMLRFEPDIIVIDSMVADSPAETGALRGEVELSGMLWLREAMWNSRVNYVFQVGMRRAGIGIWEDLPWPIQLHQVRKNQTGRERLGSGNHQQIARWAKERGIMVVFMEYATQRKNGTLDCISRSAELPSLAFKTCTVLEDSGYKGSDLFIDTNHFKPLGAKIVGEALAKELPKMWDTRE